MRAATTPTVSGATPSAGTVVSASCSRPPRSSSCCPSSQASSRSGSGTKLATRRLEAVAAQTAADARRISALGLSADDFDQALLLAVEARRLDDSTDTRSNLLAVLNQKPQVVGVIGNQPGDSLFDFVVTGDGDHLVTISPERQSALRRRDRSSPRARELAAPVIFGDGVPTPDGTGMRR